MDDIASVKITKWEGKIVHDVSSEKFERVTAIYRNLYKWDLEVGENQESMEAREKKNVSREKLSKMKPESGPWSIQAVGGGESQIRNE